jgi:lysyl-tRNA synthetase class 1
MYREPRAAKRLSFDVIPRQVDDYQQYLEAYQRQDLKQRLANPVWHIHAGAPPKPEIPIPFSMLLTLVSASNAENAETLWGFIGRYRPGVTPWTHPQLIALVGHAMNYFRDFVLPTKRFRAPTEAERAALRDLRDALVQLPKNASAEEIQDVVYEVGRREPFLDRTGKIKTKDGKPGVSLEWFNMLYQVLFGQDKGPRFGSFAAAYGVDNMIAKIDGALAWGASAGRTRWLERDVDELKWLARTQTPRTEIARRLNRSDEAVRKKIYVLHVSYVTQHEGRKREGR